jgi:hypothetical protein
MTYASTGNPFPDEAPVLVKYPQTKAEERAGRESWPWLPGTIMSRCGPDEWQVCVEARGVAMLEDGTRPPENVPDDELLFPVVFRDASEIRPGGAS